MAKIQIVMYHYVRDLIHSRYPDIAGMNIEAFENQIDFLKHNYTIISMEMLIAAVKENHELPTNSAMLTFDDGYIDHYTFVLPILEKTGIQGSFFVPGKTFKTHQLLDVNKIHYILAGADRNKLISDLFERMNYYRGVEYTFPDNKELFETYAVASRLDTAETIFIKRILQNVLPEGLRKMISSDLFERYVGVSEEKLACELYMTEDQIYTLKRHGMYIGLHGYDHYWLGKLSADEMRRDVDQAFESMEPFVDHRDWVFNYPYGSYNENVLNYIAKKGAVLGLTTNTRAADLSQDNPLELPRLDCVDFPPKSENYINLQ